VKWRFFTSLPRDDQHPPAQPVALLKAKAWSNYYAVFSAKFNVATLVLGLGIAWAELTPGPSIKGLIDQSDLILTGKVERVEEIAETSVKLQSSTYRRRVFQATISVNETIKGEVPHRISFLIIPPQPWTASETWRKAGCLQIPTESYS
jgi:hypothetical protein